MTYVVERLSEHHRTAVIDIFNIFVTTGFSAYPETEVSYAFFDRFLEMAQGYPAVAIKDQTGRVVGFAILRAYHFARTFARTAEVSYFLLPEATRQGVGTMILEMFVQEAKKMGIDSIVASISSRNEESIRFHLKNGFQECGRLRAIGKKFGEDFDVVWMQRPLRS